MNMRVFRTDSEGITVGVEEISVPVTHWGKRDRKR